VASAIAAMIGESELFLFVEALQSLLPSGDAGLALSDGILKRGYRAADSHAMVDSLLYKFNVSLEKV
jgi:hypothetical protein